MAPPCGASSSIARSCRLNGWFSSIHSRMRTVASPAILAARLGNWKCCRHSASRNLPAGKPNSPSVDHAQRKRRRRENIRQRARQHDARLEWHNGAARSVSRQSEVTTRMEDIMTLAKHKITPCLWFDTQAEEAAKFYCSIFKDSRIGEVSRYTKAGQEVHHKPPGSVMVVEFEIEGQTFTALNGGPNFKFNEAISLQVRCETQAEVDYFWSKLTQGGEEGPCGWLKDKYGVSWQVVPASIPKMMTDPDPRKSGRVMNAFLKMKKLDIDEIERAYEG